MPTLYVDKMTYDEGTALSFFLQLMFQYASFYFDLLLLSLLCTTVHTEFALLFFSINSVPFY